MEKAIRDAANAMFSITLGDGSVYYPQIENNSSAREFATKETLRVGLQGVRIERGEAGAQVVTLAFGFYGDDANINKRQFLISAGNPAPWRVVHPYMGAFIAQPTSELSFDESPARAIGKVTLKIVGEFDAVKDIEIRAAARGQADAVMQAAAEQAPPVPVVTVVNAVRGIADGFNWLPNNLEQVAALKNKVRQASAAASAAISSPARSMQSMTDLLNFPAEIQSDITRSISATQRAFAVLIATIAASPSYFGVSSGALAAVSASYAANASYINAAQAQSMRSHLERIEMERELLLDAHGGLMSADAELMLSTLLAMTRGQLIDIAASATSERVYVAERSASPVIFASLLYPDMDIDSATDRLVNDNNIHSEELVSIQKNRELKYYI